MSKLTFLRLWSLAAVGALSLGAQAQEHTFKFHHLWPAGSLAATKVIGPWCDKIAAESKNRLKCQVLHSMSGGGAPPQLLDRVKDGVDDLVITLPGYTPGRFPRMEVFDLPFTSRSGEQLGGAAWEFFDKHAKTEFAGVKTLAVWGHDPAYLHTTRKQVKTIDEFRGMKVRGPTRLANKMLVTWGATPVQLSAASISDALTKGTIDGLVQPWELISAFRLHENLKYHTELADKYPSMYNTTFFIGMNQAKYDSLPADLKAVIDRNSGLALSRYIGRQWDETTAPARAAAKEHGNVFYTLPDAEAQRWIKAAEPVKQAWVAEMNQRGLDGAQLLKAATELLEKHTK